MPAPLQRLIAVALLVVFSPVLAAVALLIRVSAGKGVIFRQERVGRNEQPFLVLKFRTMRHPPPGGWSSVTLGDDDRLLPCAGLIRRLRLDELPQLVNVVRGEMNLVGPRPTVWDDVVRMTPEQRRRHDVAPGITGLAQVIGGTSMTWPERIVLDLEYIDSRSVVRDIGIIVRTITSLTRSFDEAPLSDEWVPRSAGTPPPPPHERS